MNKGTENPTQFTAINKEMKHQESGKANESDKAEDGIIHKSYLKDTLNPNPWCRIIGPQNVAEVEINGEKVLGLLDTGCQVTNISEEFCWVQGIPIYPIDHLCDVTQADGTELQYTGYANITLSCPEFPGFQEDIPVLVVPETDYHSQVPITIGTLTLGQMMSGGTLKEGQPMSESWSKVYSSMVKMQKLQAEPSSLGKIKTTKTIVIPAMSTLTIPCAHRVRGYGQHLNVMVEPKVIHHKVQVVPTTSLLKIHESKIPVQFDNSTNQAISIPKGTVVGNVHLGNTIPKIMGSNLLASKPEQNGSNIPKASSNSQIVTDQTELKCAMADVSTPLLEGTNKCGEVPSTEAHNKINKEASMNTKNPQRGTEFLQVC